MRLAVGLVGLVLLVVFGYTYVSQSHFHASVDEEIEEDICELSDSGIMNECSGSPVGAPCGGEGEYEGVCVQVTFACDCVLPDGRLFDEVINDPLPHDEDAPEEIEEEEEEEEEEDESA